MRAKLAIAIAAFGLLMSSSQAVMADDVTNDVNYILYKTDRHGLFGGWFGGRRNACNESAAVIGGPSTLDDVGLFNGRNRSSCAEVLELPVVVAPVGCASSAIITKYPSDLDIRREDLQRRLGASGGTCGMGFGGGLSSALKQVGCAELEWRNDCYLNVKESRRLYRAMDRIGKEIQCNRRRGLFDWN